MADQNGGGRLERIEAILEDVAKKLDRVATTGYLNDEKLSHIEANIEQMQEDEKAYRAAQRDRDQVVDSRIDKLVTSIGDLIRRIPPENLR